MRVAIASRIFEPEPSAASFRLGVLADALTAAGHEVTVLTVRPPRELGDGARADSSKPYRVRRFPVLRDRAGYVRGYLQYMSFDIPLFFRLLFGPKRDLVIAEPPPTTGFFVRGAAALRRMPYAYYAADIWSDASAQTSAPAWVVQIVRAIELLALRGARTVLSVSEGVTSRLAELGVTGGVSTVGNGIDVRPFSNARETAAAGNEFVYAGTASEWHGAGVFLEALPLVLAERPEARLRFIGGGSEREMLEARANELGVADAVSFEGVLAPSDLAPVLGASAAALASVRPGSGYDFAFPTKLYSAAACGAPMVYSGIGPAVDFVRTRVDGEPLGLEAAFDARLVADAMLRVLEQAQRCTPEARVARRHAVAHWAAENVSLQAVATRIVSQSEEAVR